MHEQQPDIQQLFQEARRYDLAGDTYVAVKLYKRITKLSPQWVEPYLQLANIYKLRREWKPAYYYCKKTVSLAPTTRNAWWDLGIAATALKKWRLAGSVWAKFGQKKLPKQPLGLRLTYEGIFEILWMMPLDPARGQIMSIPHPASSFRFRDVVLYDQYPVGHHIVDQRRIPVYAELGNLKPSPYRTFSCLIHTSDPVIIKQLEQICHAANIGFEVWSHATRSFIANHHRAFPEYYSRDILPQTTDAPTMVALAAIHEAEVQHVLNSWQIVSLQNYSDLQAY